jgi:predicted nicotinamide N-methyase
MHRLDLYIRANTCDVSIPIVPEICLLLLKDNSALWRNFDEKRTWEINQRPYWAFAWGAGQALARFILDNPRIVYNKNVLDFAAGSGIAAIAAAKAGASEVTANDIDPIAVRAIQLNARANDVRVNTVCSDLIYSKDPGWEVIVAGDIWYNTRLARHGMVWLQQLAAEGICVLIGDPGRPYAPSKGIELLAAYRCRSIPDLEHPNLQKASIYRLLPANNQEQQPKQAVPVENEFG